MVLTVAKNRLRGIRNEIPYPGLYTHVSIDAEGRGLIDIFCNSDLIGHEIIETQESWKDPGRLTVYRHVIDKKIRLVVLAPQNDSMKVRMRMLELNNWWRFYYMVYSYDDEGRLARVLRPVPTDLLTLNFD
jgi:hypothetical protein